MNSFRPLTRYCWHFFMFVYLFQNFWKGGTENREYLNGVQGRSGGLRPGGGEGAMWDHPPLTALRGASLVGRQHLKHLRDPPPPSHGELKPRLQGRRN
jgi:hypothetical protein